MDRMTYRITDENRRRLEMLKAFAVFDDSYPTLQEIVNRSIECYFTSVYALYCIQCPNNELLRQRMEALLPQDARQSPDRDL